MGFDADMSRFNMELDVGAFKSNLGLDSDVSRSNLELGADMPFLNMGLGAVMLLPNLELDAEKGIILYWIVIFMCRIDL